jgi:ubiquinone/menaquinone biosynthesis C-methylase UbiE
MNIKQLKKHWNRFGETDPLWAIITWPDKAGNRWQLGDFFRTGEEQVTGIIDYVRFLGINLRRSRALDFGCGAGRLTQALSNYFNEVCGVDIAPSMIRLAESYNRHPRNCKYYLNTRADLRLFSDASFDFIYTSLTLQHMEPAYAKTYLKEFLRLLTAQGVLVFDMPSERISSPEAQGGATKANEDKNLLAKIKQFIKSFTPRPVLDFYYSLRYPEVFPRMEMHGIRRGELERFLELNGSRILDVLQTSAGPDWISYRYCVAKDKLEVLRGGDS